MGRTALRVRSLRLQQPRVVASAALPGPAHSKQLTGDDVNYEVRWDDSKLMINLEGWHETGAPSYILLYPLVWNPFFRRESHICFDVVTGELVSAFVTCADLLGAHDWFRQAWAELFGEQFWTDCMELVQADKHLLSPMLLTLNWGDQISLIPKWEQLYELALEVDLEMERTALDVSQAQPRVQGCRVCRTDGYLAESTQTLPIFCNCAYGARRLLEQLACLRRMPNTSPEIVQRYWERARAKVTGSPTLITYVTVEQVDQARDRLLPARVTTGT